VNSSLPECHHNIVDSYGISVRITTDIYINTTGATSGSGAPEFTQLFRETRATRPLALYICFLDRCFSFCTLYRYIRVNKLAIALASKDNTMANPKFIYAEILNKIFLDLMFSSGICNIYF
jgi:hypothetical protein